MAQVLISTAGSVNGETEASEQLKNRSLLFNAQSEVLKIKWNDELIPIAGAVKQNKLIAGDNIEINNEIDEIRLADDIIIKTMTLSPANTDIPNWKGTIKIGELAGGNCILLIVKESAGEQAENGIIGGEILIKSVEGDLVNYSQYILTITSTGSWTLKGGSNSSEGAYVCKCLYNGEYYYGLKMPCLKKVIESGIEEVEQVIPPENSEVWFNGWKSIPESLTPPNGYTDSQIIYEILKQSSSGENFKDIIEIPVDSNISDIKQTIQNLSPTGEDGDVYKIKLSGTLTLTDLKAIAEVCKDPEKQIYLDLSECTVAEDAQTWNVGLFRSCVSLRGLSIPQGVRQIISTEFLWCTYLRVLDLSPSAGTLYELGASSNWGTIRSLLSSTRIRFLIVPNSVTRLTNYFMGASNIKKLVFTHQNNESLSVSDWTFQVHDSSGNLVSTIPTGFHLYVTESWWNNYLYNNFIKDDASQKWQWSSTTYWTKEVVDSIVTYDPNWNKEQWQAFATEYGWSEEEVNNVRRYFGLSDLDLKQA